jgi:hypothetical protein
MGKATFKMVAATDGSPPSPSGHCYHLLAHAVATVLLLITLVAAMWQFMDWIVKPSCLADTSLSSSMAPSSSAAPATTTSPVASGTVPASELRRTPGRARVYPTTPDASYQHSAELSLSSGDCRCPHQR